MERIITKLIAIEKSIYKSLRLFSHGMIYLKSLQMAIKAEADGYIQMATAPSYDLPDPSKSAGKIVGWGKRTDFEFQDLRNCN